MIINYQSILILYWEGTHNERKKQLVARFSDSVKVPSEIVKKTLEPSVHQIGEGFGNIFYLVFAPILKAKIRKDIEIQKYKEEIEAEILKIPPEKRIEPPLSIVGPALEASKYYIDHDVIRSMFSKLVASSMNIDFTNRAHASFIEIIKQLSPLDAVNFKFLVENRGGIGVGNIRIEDTTPPNGGIDWVRNFIPFPELTIEKLDVYIASVDNLCRLGLILIDSSKSYTDKSKYERLKQHPVYIELENRFNDNPNFTKRVLVFKEAIYDITRFGADFAQCCL